MALAVLLLFALWGAITPAASQQLVGGGRSQFDCEQYVPVPNACPAEAFAQEKVGGALFDDEKQWLEARAAAISFRWEEYLGTIGAKIPDLDVLALVAVNAPRIGLASSGGGLRATLNTAGVVSSLDAREPKASNSLTAGVQQLLTYFSGISGGSWAVGSLFHNNFKRVSEWAPTLKLDTGLLVPGEDETTKANNLRKILKCADAKTAAGYPASTADLYQRSLAMGLLDNTMQPEGINAAIDYTLSGMLSGDVGNPVATAQAPLPIIESGLYAKTSDMVSNISLGVWRGVLVPWEASPLWSGSYHPNVDSFVKTRYTGTPYGACDKSGNEDAAATTNYDTLGFLMAGSGLYAGAGIDIDSPEAAKLQKTSAIFPTSFGFEIPNPFGSQENLFVTDSGLGDFGSTPLLSLMLPAREVKIIFMVDSSGGDEGTNGFPNGNELFVISDYARNIMGYPFPSVPTSRDEFLEQGLNVGVTFFGCYEDAPTIVYIPNQMVTYASNVSTFKFVYSDAEIKDMIDNGFSQLTDNPEAPEADVAIACLLVLAAGQRPPSCRMLLQDYCWTPDEGNGIGGERDPNGCLAAAGEVWCIALMKCIRPWEEDCSPGSSDDPGTSSAGVSIAGLGFTASILAFVASLMFASAFSS